MLEGFFMRSPEIPTKRIFVVESALCGNLKFEISNFKFQISTTINRLGYLSSLGIEMMK